MIQPRIPAFVLMASIGVLLSACGSSGSTDSADPAPQAVNGTCGSANGVAVSAAPTASLCSSGSASAVSGSGPWNWMCTGTNGGTTSSCQAPVTSSSGGGGSGGGGSGGGGSGGSSPVNGVCGSANGTAVSSAPTANLCTTGTASTVSGTGPWTWMCTGSGGGTDSSCQAPVASGSGGGGSGGGGSGGTSPTNGMCGSANGVAVSVAPTSNLCTAGTASAVAGNGPWNWMCAGLNGGTTANCSAPLTPPPPVNGVCGAANGVAVSTAPTANLCTTGTASAVSGNGPWNWMCTGSNGGSTGSCSAPLSSGSGSGGGSPVLVQHVASSANPVGLGISGNHFKIPLPNPVLSGDALVLGITFPHGNSSTVTDSLGQSWPAAAITEDGGSGNYVTQIYVLCGSTGGNDTISVGLTNSTLPFQYTVSEFNTVATSGCVDGTGGGANLAPGGSATISPGAFTPSTNNNSNGGHVIWNYTALASQASGNPTAWTAASGFTLLDADIAWFDKQGFPHASQWYLQSSNGSVTPSIQSTGDTSDRFNSASVALLVANAGGAVPSSIHINKILHQSWTAPTSSSLTLQIPATGNLRVLAFTVGLNSLNITSITDNESGTWKIEQSNGDSSQIWYSANRSANPNLQVTLHLSGASDTNSVRFFDIQGASASPVDVAAGTDPTSCLSGTINNQPDLTPTSGNELVIATMGIGDGPGLGLASGAPSGAVWDLTTYSGEVDNDLMENADALAHVYITSGGPETWNWSITVNGGNSCTAEAVAFK